MPVQVDPFLSTETGYRDKQIITTGDEFQRMVNFLGTSPVVVFDSETSGLEWFKHARICGLAFAGWNESEGIQNFYIPVRHRTGERQLDLGIIDSAVKGILADDRPKICHNIKFDDHMIRREGWKFGGLRYDTMFSSRLYDENRLLGLKVRAREDLGRTDADVWEKRVEGKVVQLAKLNKMNIGDYKQAYGYSQVPIGMCGTYACFDVEFTAGLYLLHEKNGISSQYSRIWNTEMQLTEAICDMEETGIPVDINYLELLRDRLFGVMAGLEDQIFNMLGRKFNLASDDDVRGLLLNYFNLRWTKYTKAGKLSVDKEVLQQFESVHPVIPKMQVWRECHKLATTYTDSILNRLDTHNLLHADYQQIGTNTGRTSCRSPNFQNQPSDNNDRAIKNSGKSLEDGGVDPYSIRRAFITRGNDWVRLFYDYSQIELRVLAFYSKDDVMVDAYMNGEDIHSRTSKEVFGTTEKAKRRMAKVINFGLAYSMSAIGFSRQIGIPISEAEMYLNKFFERYRGVALFRQSFWHYVRSNKCEFQNIFGRPRRVPIMNSDEPKDRGRGERQAIASLIQGTAAELTKESMVRIWRYFKDNKIPAYLTNTVHDEIQIDCQSDVVPYIAKPVKEMMEWYPEFSPIPIIVDAEYSTKSWADKQKLKIGE